MAQGMNDGGGCPGAKVLRSLPNGLELSGPARLLSTENRALAGSAAASCYAERFFLTLEVLSMYLGKVLVQQPADIDCVADDTLAPI